MPSVGMPSSKTPGSTFGAPSAYTDAGPPDRISARGLRARISSGVARCETSSEYTRASRTRRAISCEYCPPKSTTNTPLSFAGVGKAATCSFLAGSVEPTPARAKGSRASGAAVIRRILRDRDVVRVRLAQPGARDAHELRFLQSLDRRRAAVAHRLAKAADELVQHTRERPLVRHAPLDALRHELLDILDVALEIAVLREAARFHGSERPHAAVLLEALALGVDDVARRLVRAGEHAADHHGVRARRD